jgi:hypothetical protein
MQIFVVLRDDNYLGLLDYQFHKIRTIVLIKGCYKIQELEMDEAK